MIHLAVALLAITLITFIFGLLGLAGLSVKTGCLFAVLALTFMVGSVRLNKLEWWGHHTPTEARADERMFAPGIRMRIVPATFSGESTASQLTAR